MWGLLFFIILILIFLKYCFLIAKNASFLPLNSNDDFFLIEIQWTYNIILVLGIPHSDSILSYYTP